MDLANVAIDVFSILLCAVLGLYALASDGFHDRISACFAGICFSNALMAAGDATSWMFALPISSLEYAIVLIGSFFFYAATAPLFLFFTAYIIAFLTRKGARIRGYLGLSLVLFALYIAGCIASLFGEGFFFHVSPQAGYERGSFFTLAQVVPIALHLRNAALVIRHNALLNTRERLGFASYIVLPMIAEVIQVAVYGIALMNTFVAFAVLLVFLNIQSERKVLLTRREKELAEARAEIMLSQIQPHFLYNTLTAIRELCLADPHAAADAITDFSAYLRANMASLSSREPISFNRELDHVRTYLALEKRRFDGRLTVRYDIETTDFALPPLTLQVLVENAVRHGIAKRREGGNVSITARKDDTGVVVSVVDDGIGFDTTRLQGEGSGRHVGIANARMRLETLCNGTLEVDSAPGAGTVATIYLSKARNAEF